jgi:predicted site-specific integrase-resolvase
MTIKIKGLEFDTMKEACERLSISRPTLIKYIDENFFTPPKIHKQGRSKRIRIFDDAWYRENEPKLER